ncbi:MAG: S8 family serine peptidase [Marinobacter sp.]|uniref:S8 family serine peptidase n=1 Tax=Marinobacter sp. TaxID=50741 RepID=UPI0034A071A3
MQISVRYGLLTALSFGLLTACENGGGGGSSESAEMDDLSGTISIEARSRVDSDTADDIRVGLAIGNSPNDERPGSTPQSLPGSGIFGGYVSVTGGVYTDSGFDFYADAEDQIQTQLAAGDRVALQVFAADTNLAGPDVEFSINTTSGDLCGVNCQDGPPFVYVHEQATVDAIIAISAKDGGPARYVLTVTSDTQTPAMNVAYAEPGFRVDEAVITSQPAKTGTLVQAAALGASEARALGNGAWHLRRVPASVARIYSGDELEKARKATLDWIRELQVRSDILAAGPNYLYNAQTVEPNNDPLYQLQWHYPLINLPLAWQLAPNAGESVGVAVMDTGLFSTSPGSYGNWHEDLVENVPVVASDIIGPDQFLDFVTGTLDIDTQPGRDRNPADPGDGKAQSSNFHGTHVAGIVAAADNSIGMVGVASKSTLIPVRVLGRDGSGSLSDLIAAINWAATNGQVDVINLSLGGVGPDASLERAINAAAANGKLVVAAAGNQGSDVLTFPAAFDNVIGVGAVDGARKRAGYSNIGGSVDLVAPGGDASRDANNDGNADLVISAWGEDSGDVFEARYAGLQGTSMAAPHVAGVYALMKEAARSAGTPEVTPQQFASLLQAGLLTDDVGNATEYGAGLINALKAVNAALDGSEVKLLSSTPSSLQFSEAVSSQGFSLAAYPEDSAVTVDTVNVPEWIELTPVPSGPPTGEIITATVIMDGLEADASLRDVITINYTGGSQPSLEIPVRLQLGNVPGDTDAGRHYVLLVSTDDDPETLAQQVVESSDGGYRFAFTDLEPGEYFLVAGTDNDNNGFICETGEACAEYPVNGLPEKIVIGNEPISGVTLTTSFRRPTISSMGLPRYGFGGYRLMTGPSDQSTPIRQLESAP